MEEGERREPERQSGAGALRGAEDRHDEHAGQHRVRVAMPPDRRLTPGTLMLARVDGRRCVLRLPPSAGATPSALLCMAPWIDGGGDGDDGEEGIRPSGGGGAFSEATILLPGEATPGQQLVATAPDGTFVAFRVPDPLPAHRRIRLRLPASTSIKTQWRGVTARGLKVHDENGAELSLGGR